METTSIRHSITSLIVYGRVATEFFKKNFSRTTSFRFVQQNFNIRVIEWGLPEKILLRYAILNILSMVKRTPVSPMLTGKIGNITSQIKLTRTCKEHLVICNSSCNTWNQLALGVTKKASLKKFA